MAAQVRIKKRNNSRFEEAFNMLYSLVYIRAPGAHEDSVLLLQRSQLEAMIAAFKGKQPLLKPLETHWKRKRCARSHSTSLWFCAGLIDAQYRQSRAMNTCQ
jgi:hypothetical protein